jgi:hypothetical protein
VADTGEVRDTCATFVNVIMKMYTDIEVSTSVGKNEGNLSVNLRSEAR